jgi:8-oxo-dGTP pyrophosphatase MutT (NUDIX family)
MSIGQWCGVLDGHDPVDARERASIDEFRRVAPLLARPFDESADPVHVTASAIVVSEDGTRTVLHLHKRLGMWIQPGGHIETGEDPLAAAVREAREETGLPVRPWFGDRSFLHVDVHPGPRGHTHLDLRFLLSSPLVDPEPAEGESAQVAWFAWTDAVLVADAALDGALEAARRRLQHPG